MKANKIAKVQIALLAIACCLQIYNMIDDIRREVVVYNSFACDLTFRINEINCMHDGIDPFDIFERKVTSEKYRGINRPDIPCEPQDARRAIHSYPAWHATVFWWYSYISNKICIVIMICLYICSLSWVCKWTSSKVPKTNAKEYTVYILSLLTMILPPLGGICWSLNYGLILLACSLLLYSSLDSGHDFLAGVIYSFIMIKPQIGLLLIFPLSFNRKFKTIILATLICLIETCFTAYMLNKSPIELILQIPKIGAPFEKGFLTEHIIKIVGPNGQYINMGIFMCLAAAGSYFARNAKEAWMRFIPAIAVIPFWTYSQYHDWLVVLPCYIYILNSKGKYRKMAGFCFFMMILLVLSLFAHNQHWYMIGKWGAIVILNLAIVLFSCLMVILDTDSNEAILHLVNKLTSFRDPKRLE